METTLSSVRVSGLPLLIIVSSCLLPAPTGAQESFLRANANGDAAVDISDAVFTLAFLFLGGPPPGCPDAADANDDGKIDISDAVYTLAHLFLGGPAPPPPGSSEPGLDPTGDALACGGADTDPPAAAANLATSPPSGANDNDPEITGTAEPGATVEVFLAGGGAGGGQPPECPGTPIALTSVEPGGTFSVTVHVDDDTTSSFIVHVVDAAGNVSPCSESLTYVEDSTAPSSPAITGTSPASPSGQRSPQVLGTAEPEASIALFLNASCSGDPAALGQASAAGAFAIPLAVPDGATVSITATATDAAGNASTCSGAASYTHVPAAPATRLDFTQAPAGAGAGRPFRASVAARDDAGNLDTAFAGQVTIAIGQGPPGAMLSGMASGNAVGGVFRASDLTLDAPGTYTLTAAAPGLMAAETTPFVVHPPSVPPTVDILGVTGSSGCARIRYRLVHPQRLRTNVLIEFSPDDVSPFRPVTPSGINELVHIITAPAPGVIRNFNWNAKLDLETSTTTARVRITPSLESDGTPGVAVTREGITFDFSHISLAAGPQLSSPGAAGLATGDLDGDGRLDIASVNPGLNRITAHIQDFAVTGFFSTTRLINTGAGPSSVGTIDFNLDGRQDVLTTLAAGSVEVLRNDGAGGFSATAMGTTGAGPVAIEMGDIDGDAWPDVVTANPGDDTVTVLLQDGNGGFQAPAHFPVGGGPRDIALADLQGDGRLDFLTVNHDASSMSVFVQDPSAPGGFVAEEDRPLSGSPLACDVADVDDDGRNDVALALEGESSIPVLYGVDDAEGRWKEEGIPLHPSCDPNDVDTGDFDGDTDLDIACGCDEGGLGIAVQVKTGEFEDASDSDFDPGASLEQVEAADWSGDCVDDVVAADTDGGAVLPSQSLPTTCQSEPPLGRSLALPVPIPTGGVASLASGFLDGDAFTDIAAGAADTVVVFAGIGDGRLRVSTFFQEGELTTDVLLADVNGDANGDMVWISSGSVFAAVSNQNSSFQPIVVSHPGGNAAVAGLFDGDEQVDLVVAGDTQVSFLKGNGAAGFAAVKITNLKIKSVGAGDFDGDGELEVAGAAPTAGSYQILGDPEEELHPVVVLPAGLDPGEIVVFDADGDGQDDLAGVNEDDGTVSVFIRGADGTFAPAPGSPYPAGTSPRGIDAGDVNGDLIPDLAITDAALGVVYVLHGQGDGRFTDSGASVPVGEAPVAIELAILDGHPSADLAVAGASGVVTLVSRGESSATSNPLIPGGQGTELTHTAVADFNHDGVPDTVFVDSHVSAGSLGTIYLRNEQGGVEVKNFDVDGGARSLSIGDFNRDSHLDLVITFARGITVVYTGNGRGEFTFGPEITGGFLEPSDSAVADVDRDGDLDLTVANGGSNTVSILLGGGNGTFSFTGTTITGSQPGAIDLADFNRDGIVDLAAANTGASTATISPGAGNGVFAVGTTLATPSGPTGISAGDVHGDGRVDVVVAHPRTPAQNSLTLFPGAAAPGTFESPVGIFTTGDVKDVLVAGQVLAGFNGTTLSIHQRTGGNIFTVNQNFVLPVAAAKAPVFADPSAPKDGAMKFGLCAVGRFEHLGGPTVQRLAALFTVLAPLAALAALGRRERRRQAGAAPR